MISDIPPKIPTVVVERSFIKTAEADKATNDPINLPVNDNLGGFYSFSGSANASATGPTNLTNFTYPINFIPEFGPIPAEELKKQHLATIFEQAKEIKEINE